MQGQQQRGVCVSGGLVQQQTKHTTTLCLFKHKNTTDVLDWYQCHLPPQQQEQEEQQQYSNQQQHPAGPSSSAQHDDDDVEAAPGSSSGDRQQQSTFDLTQPLLPAQQAEQHNNKHTTGSFFSSSSSRHNNKNNNRASSSTQSNNIKRRRTVLVVGPRWGPWGVERYGLAPCKVCGVSSRLVFLPVSRSFLRFPLFFLFLPASLVLSLPDKHTSSSSCSLITINAYTIEQPINNNTKQQSKTPAWPASSCAQVLSTACATTYERWGLMLPCHQHKAALAC